MRAALSHTLCTVCHKLLFSQNNINYFTCAFNLLSDACFQTCLYEIYPFLHQELRKGGNLLKLQYTTYGRAARKWRHKIETWKMYNFFILWWIFVKPSLISFSHSSAFNKPNIISGSLIPKGAKSTFYQNRFIPVNILPSQLFIHILRFWS